MFQPKVLPDNLFKILTDQVCNPGWLDRKSQEYDKAMAIKCERYHDDETSSDLTGGRSARLFLST